MTAYVEECRRELRRLGVPDLLAEEMANELEADLSEAEADGISAAELLGESDPRRFAANWAVGRGLVSPQPPRKSRKWLWISIAAGVVVFLIVVPVTLGALAVFSTASVSIRTSRAPVPVRSVVIPNLVGLKACHAKRIALESRLRVRTFPKSRCNAVVVSQKPVPGTLVQWPQGALTVVKLRLRG